jgi:hypothetical protein
MPTNDLRTYKRLGKRATEMTGYPAISIFHNFKYDPKDYIKGTFSDWMYEFRGTYGWTTEIWNVQRQAGVTVPDSPLEWFREHPIEDDFAIMKWNDEQLDGKGYVEWYEYDHPQLGKVELGGWNFMYTWRNPPHHLLEKEIAPLVDFAIYGCLVSPKLELHTVEVQSIDDMHHIRLVLQNTGWLPTNVTQKALQMKVVRELEVDIALPNGAKLVMGKEKTMLGQLAGRDQKPAMLTFGSDPMEDRVKVEWVVQAAAGTEVGITAVHERAGTVRTTVKLGD